MSGEESESVKPAESAEPTEVEPLPDEAVPAVSDEAVLAAPAPKPPSTLRQ